MRSRKKARRTPKGSQTNMAKEERGVGRKAILPSWKTRGSRWSSMGSWRPDFFFACLTVIRSCGEGNGRLIRERKRVEGKRKKIAERKSEVEREE